MLLFSVMGLSQNVYKASNFNIKRDGVHDNTTSIQARSTSSPQRVAEPLSSVWGVTSPEPCSSSPGSASGFARAR